MTNYQEGRVKLTNTKLNKLRSAEKKKKNWDEELAQKLFLTTRQTSK